MTLWEFLSINIGVLSLIVVAVIILLFILLVVMIYKLKIKRIGPLEFSNSDAQVIVDRFMRVVERVREYEREITRIVEGTILREQMRIAEIAISDIVRDVKKIHLDLINCRTKEENFKRATEELNTYHLRLEIMTDDIKDEFRRSFRQNHFVEKTPKEFTDYIRREMEIIFLIIEDSIDHRYSSDLINADELKEANRYQINNYRRILEGVYTEAREIALVNAQRVNTKREKIKKITSSYLQNLPLEEDCNICEDDE